MSIGIIIPCYNEEKGALESTIRACNTQSILPEKIVLIDDCSSMPVELSKEVMNINIIEFRNDINLGISASRNKGIALLDTKYIACINVDVLPQNNWLEVCQAYMDENSVCGACYTKIIPNPNNLVSKYRMRFQEKQFKNYTGLSDWAPGHAVFFRKEVLDKVKGYNEQLRLIYEDSEICERIKTEGYEIHFIASTYCESIQKDTLQLIAKKQIIRNGFLLNDKIELGPLIISLINTLKNRLWRNFLKLRWQFLPLDFITFFLSIRIAIAHSKTKA